MQGPGLFDAAAELIALASDKPLSQVRAELAPAPTWKPCTACGLAPCVCPDLFSAPANDLIGKAQPGAKAGSFVIGAHGFCEQCTTPLALAAGGGYGCVRCSE